MDIGQVKLVAALLRAARSVVALTGAGVSAESGIPTFRGADGLWRTFQAQDLATPAAFARDPRLVWNWYRWRRERIRVAEPNPAHFALARLETRLASLLLVTQNVDGLHRRAGSRKIVELHGNIWRAVCWSHCGFEADQSLDQPSELTAEDADPPLCRCGALLRPGVVWFGEALDPAAIEGAMSAAQSCDVLLVVGTSSMVYPAAALPAVAHRAGAAIVEINLDQTPLTAEADVVLTGRAGELLPEVERWL